MFLNQRAVRCFLGKSDGWTSFSSQFYYRHDVIVNKIVIAIEEMIKCMSAKRIIVALGYENMKELSMLQVFDKANNSVRGSQCIHVTSFALC
jgi:hypothetical protein